MGIFKDWKCNYGSLALSFIDLFDILELCWVWLYRWMFADALMSKLVSKINSENICLDHSTKIY